MESGVSAFLVKDSPADKLTQTIRRVLAGERVIDPDLAAAALADGVNPLTPRERDVLEASADGRTIAEIAAQLYLSEGTVGITCPRASRRPGPGTAPRRSASPPNAAGCRPETLG
jgi:Response regulator containing a CheY-like receiver domain and an HTH DNA-binding domain